MMQNVREGGIKGSELLMCRNENCIIHRPINHLSKAEHSQALTITIIPHTLVRCQSKSSQQMRQ